MCPIKNVTEVCGYDGRKYRSFCQVIPSLILTFDTKYNWNILHFEPEQTASYLIIIYLNT